jgi:hypothetical protein
MTGEKIPRELTDPPSVVQVTVLPAARRRQTAQLWITSRARGTAIALLLVAAIGTAAALASGSELTAAPRHQPRPLTVAAAYGHPSRCLVVTISSTDPAYARADFDRGEPCGRYGGYVTAIFRHVGAAWRPVLVGVSYSCPVAALPAPVQEELDVCLTSPLRPGTH